MKEITIKAYTFEELSEDVQERLIDEYRQYNDYSSDLEDYLRERLKELAGMSFDLEYSLCYRQGDGLRFTGRIEGHEIDKMPFAHLVKDTENTIINIFPKYVWHTSYTVDIDIDADTCYDSQEYYDDEWEKLQNAVEEWYKSVRDTLEEEGYKYIEEMESDEYIREILINCDDMYMEDGRRI
jgi:hypothetical protein|uniref:Uncharacterized protein n=1 Tax=Myoviridae sp. ctqfO1 TaxID=2827710 RepID=A0A8S5T2B0_9CAUD|nr:MAG TPA: hypothetical protein [Myoviridae sp. ctqfO1]